MKHIQFTVRYCKLLYFTVRLSAIFGQFRTPRHDGIYLFVCRNIAPFRHFVSRYSKTISLCCFNDTHHISTCIKSFIHIAKQKILSVDKKWIERKQYGNFASLTYTKHNDLLIMLVISILFYTCNMYCEIFLRVSCSQCH